ncbi:early nodulin-like protein 9 [Gastrolobium bilobum]|uniref:early nodulin-like protein 9 n=1 Tax=Gastrolobium bilobum TaxID=150636 RepID=UPI002AB298A4|nr:early nodulin-like protein 9 [Gastrolobium bilobum]
MATINLRSNEVVPVLGLFCLLLLVHKGDAYEFIVGGQKGWSVPSDPNSNPYNQWAEKSRFQMGDSLVFNYPSGQDSVIQVNSQDYASCNTGANTEKFSDGHTVIKLNKSGPQFFISGNKNSCLKNEKLVVIVLAERNNRNSNTNQTSTASPSPTPSPLPSLSTKQLAPAPAPVLQQVPSPLAPTVETPSPTQQEAPSPPTGTGGNNPTSAPVSEPPPNAASSILVTFAGSVGAFMASVLVLSF